MTGERIIFGNSVEGMLRAVPEFTPPVLARLAQLGVNPNKLLPGYDVPTYVRLLDYLGELRFPSLSAQDRDVELGREFIRGFGRTFVGKATLAMGRVLGPMRGVQRMTRTMRTVTNYSTAEAVVHSASHVTLVCSPVARPWYYVGVLAEAGQTLYGSSYTVTLKSVLDEKCEFDISW